MQYDSKRKNLQTVRRNEEKERGKKSTIITEKYDSRVIHRTFFMDEVSPELRNKTVKNRDTLLSFLVDKGGRTMRA